MSYRFEIEAGKSKRFPVGGKYCEDDIVVTAVGGAPAPDVPDEPATPEYSEGLEVGYNDAWSWWEVLGYGTWDGEHLVIPPYTDGGEPIEGIGYDALDNNARVKSATLPETMIWIVNQIFISCPSLTHIYMPYIRSIASICFTDTTSLKYVQFRDIVDIGGYNFIGCTDAVFDFSECQAVPSFDSYNEGEFGANPVILVPAELYDEWKSATNWALYADYIVVKGQENAQEKEVEYTENGSYEIAPDEGKLLSKVKVNVNVSGGGDSAFIDDFIEGNITEISSNVVTVRGYCFYRNNNLVRVDLPNATSLGEYAFRECKALNSVNLPNLTSAGNYSFAGCTALLSIVLPNVLNLVDRTFYECTGLTSITIPKAENIGTYAFYGCTKLASITLPKVTSILQNAFAKCTSCLVYDFSDCEAVPKLGSTNAFTNINANAEIKVPSALYDEWIAATNWATYAKYIVAV